VWEALTARVIDLAQPYRAGIPHWPTHPPFTRTLTKLHGELVLPNGASSAADAISLGTHTGTHIDALSHFSCGGKLYGGRNAATCQDYTAGMAELGVETVAPIVRRGVLVDVAPGGVAPPDFTVGPEHFADAPVQPGDVVLLRTGWARYWNEPARFLNGMQTPGPGLESARWLSERGVFAAGSDTAAFERMPSPEMEVHVHLLVESGIHILECLNLEELAATGTREFLFIAAPLKIMGATGSPIRPLALIQTVTA
jgi:kynurenine formamidase